MRPALALCALALCGWTFVPCLADEEAGQPLEEAEHIISPGQLHAVHKVSDKNNDGKMSFHELMDHYLKTRKSAAGQEISGVFEVIDHDKDGKVSLDEVRDGHDEDSIHWHFETSKFHLADHDKSGFLSEEELISTVFPGTSYEMQLLSANHSIQMWDKDGDGHLDRKELFAFASDGNHPENDDSVRQDNADRVNEDFLKLDLDGNGKLDAHELLPLSSGLHHIKDTLNEFFKLADSDSDQHLTADEMVASRSSIAGLECHYHLLELANLTDHNDL